MKKAWLLVVLLLSLCSIGLAVESMEPPSECKHCGMNRTTFSRSRMVLTYKDGSSVGTCSLNCVVTDMKSSRGKGIARTQVADYNSGALIDAGVAVWVIGGSKKGVMSKVPKWAFATKQGADTFVRENGGKLADYREVLKSAEQEYADRTKQENPTRHKEHGNH